MPDPKTKAQLDLADQQLNPVGMAPCTITQVTPLLITVLGATNVPAQKVLGATYTLNALGNALITKQGQPMVLPLG